ncbi:MAG: VWA domain-containing protein [Desulfobacterales bacterium]|jgi:hypothetical protein|nr:VWA domain-containing protein [Desulfobacterales bacterium]
MVPLLIRFVAGARAAGLRVSTAEVLDCLQQLERIDPLEAAQFKAVLQANFAKSRREQAHFERLFRLFFHELRQDPSIARSPELAAAIRSILQSLQPAAGCDPALQAIVDFLAGDPVQLLAQTADGSLEAGAPGSASSGGGSSAKRRAELADRIRMLEEQLTQALSERRGELGWEERRDLSEHFQDRLAVVRRLLGEADEHRSPPEGRRRRLRHSLDELGEIHFASLTPREVEAMREAIALLVRRLRDRIARRQAARRRGVLDVKKILRRAAAYEGVPLEVFHRRRSPRKARIVTLCDVSGSVWSAARFMLNMLYSLQGCFAQVRSFIFVAGVQEVSEVFKQYAVNPAIEKILKDADIDYNAATDYGRTFREFRQHYLDILNRQTTLIIIGDGRCNYTDPQEQILAEMRARCRRLIWLNPEAPQFWTTGDSEMRVFEAVCEEVRPCQNLNQLVAFITALVL